MKEKLYAIVFLLIFLVTPVFSVHAQSFSDPKVCAPGYIQGSVPTTQAPDYSYTPDGFLELHFRITDVRWKYNFGLIRDYDQNCNLLIGRFGVWTDKQTSVWPGVSHLLLRFAEDIPGTYHFNAYDGDTGLPIVLDTSTILGTLYGDNIGYSYSPAIRIILGNRTSSTKDIDWDTETGDLISTPALPMRIKPRVSNVLFLPGIEASRLYRHDYAGGTDKLWEPNADADVQDLYMNPDGTSARSDVYAKEKDVIDELPDGENIYKSFIAKMDGLKAGGAIADWEPIAYDWRLSLDDILNYGNDVGGRIYYSGDLRATSTPYVIQELKRLAASSKTGKATIVAHSNGGLLAKRLTQLLGPAESARLIDKMIFIAVPQTGTPMAIPAGLHGYEQDHILGLITSKNTARTFASASPMAYNLLPSAKYFTYVDNPVITFDALLTDWISRYGNIIHSQDRLHQFLTDSYGRVDAQTGDTDQPIQFSDSLLSSAEALHTSLDIWTPPTGVQLTQIAGWGVPKTVEGTTYKKKGTGVMSDADFTIDGDGTVVVPSALWTSTTTGAVNYWMDLNNYNRTHPFQSGFGYATFDHSRIFETDPVLNFVSDQIASTTKPLSDYGYLSTQAPAASDLRLRYALHSPLTLNLYDDQGRHTGVSTTTGKVEEQIPGTYYTEFGDVKYLFTGASTPAHIILDGYASGTFTFDAGQYTGDTLTASATFKDIPTSTTTVVTMNVASDLTTLSPMAVDEDGDGMTDMTLIPKIDSVVTPDTTPPELQISFSTTVQALAFTSTDDSGTTTMTMATAYPTPKKGKQGSSVATTTVTAIDSSGNTTALIYTESYPSPASSDAITLRSLAYNDATTTLATTTLSYTWKLDRSGSYQSFVSSLQTATMTLGSQYKPRNDTTIITTGATTSTLPGMVVPYMATKQGRVIINY